MLWALAKTGGRQLDAARLLGVQPSTLNEKMKRLEIARSCDAAGMQGEQAAEEAPEARRSSHTPGPEPLRRRLT